LGNQPEDADKETDVEAEVVNADSDKIHIHETHLLGANEGNRTVVGGIENGKSDVACVDVIQYI